jgi:ribonuclease PH
MTSVSMLPRSTHLRVEQPSLAEALQAELHSIQSLIGRSLRAAVAESEMNRIALTVDCCVACSDAGIAAASVAGSWVAMYQAMRWAALNNLVDTNLYINQVAGLSGGLVNGEWILDLCAEEAKVANFVVNFVFNEKREIVDVRAGAEGSTLAVKGFAEMLVSASQNVEALFKEQERAVLELQ